MKNLLALIPILLLLGSASARTQEKPLEVFAKANQLFEKSDFQGAVDLYESLVRERQINAGLLYNLGNAYYRKGQPGYALLNYERALRLAPRDGDIRYNLSFVRRMVKEPQRSFGTQLADRLCSILTLNELTTACSALFILAIAGACVFLVRKERWAAWMSASILFAALISGTWLWFMMNREVYTRWAIITSGPCDARNGPGENSSVGFTLPEGRKVLVLGESNEWIAVGLTSEGLRGWVEKKYLEEI